MVSVLLNFSPLKVRGKRGEGGSVDSISIYSSWKKTISTPTHPHTHPTHTSHIRASQSITLLSCNFNLFDLKDVAFYTHLIYDHAVWSRLSYRNRAMRVPGQYWQCQPLSQVSNKDVSGYKYNTNANFLLWK